MFYRRLALFAVYNLLAGLLQNLREDDLVTDYRKFSTKSGNELVQYALDMVRERLPFPI
jgi:uncharacterized protein (DUF433 family)